MCARVYTLSRRSLRRHPEGGQGVERGVNAPIPLQGCRFRKGDVDGRPKRKVVSETPQSVRRIEVNSLPGLLSLQKRRSWEARGTSVSRLNSPKIWTSVILFMSYVFLVPPTHLHLRLRTHDLRLSSNPFLLGPFT